MKYLPGTVKEKPTETSVLQPLWNTSGPTMSSVLLIVGESFVNIKRIWPCKYYGCIRSHHFWINKVNL